MADKLILGGHEFQSRFILGSGKYNLRLIKAAVEQGGAQIITLALRRANTQEKENILDFIPKGVTLLPNTSGARNAEEAVRIARLARAMGCGDFVKVEIMHDAKYLFPDNYETIKATEVLAGEGFIVLPYMNPDLNVARDLQNAGAAAVMPLAAPIGSNKGLATKEMIQILIDEIDLPIIVDAGIGKPSQACEAAFAGAEGSQHRHHGEEVRGVVEVEGEGVQGGLPHADGAVLHLRNDGSRLHQHVDDGYVGLYGLHVQAVYLYAAENGACGEESRRCAPVGLDS